MPMWEVLINQALKELSNIFTDSWGEPGDVSFLNFFVSLVINYWCVF